MVEAVLREQIIERLLSVSDSKLKPGDITETTSLRQDLGIGSLDLVGLAADLEDELDIDIDDDVLGRIQTIGELFEAIDDATPPSKPA
jgi:acyl carrier protein